MLDERNPEIFRLIDIIYVDQSEPAEKYWILEELGSTVDGGYE